MFKQPVQEHMLSTHCDGKNHCGWFADLLISRFHWSSLTSLWDSSSLTSALCLPQRQFRLTSNKARASFGCLPVLHIDAAESFAHRRKSVQGLIWER